MNLHNGIFKTQSLCPICLKKVNASIVSSGNKFYMIKKCPEHGLFKTVIWKGSIPMDKWMLKKEPASIKNPQTKVEKGCPYDCGICGEHRQHTCTALIEVTQNCNLHCRFCFADSKSGKENDPTLEQINALYESVFKTSGICNIQLSGGEPTLRDDLPQLIENGKQIGFKFIQVNTNGVRLAQDELFVKKLKSAGLDSVFLQFDGTNDTIYKKLRERELLAVKTKAIENCRKYGIGVVLVPTLVPGVNTNNVGEIIDFALKHIEAVKGVHFQPVSYFGRVPKQPEEKDRITLPELMDEIEKQTAGKIKAKSLKPPQCENSLCSFHGNFLYLEHEKLLPISGGSGCCSPKAEEGAVKAKVYVSKNWAGRQAEKNQIDSQNDSDWDKILDCIHNKSFSLSAMAFQDVWNVDLNRIQDCCIHVVNPQGKLIPFCMYNLTDIEGKSLYRTRS